MARAILKGNDAELVPTVAASATPSSSIVSEDFGRLVKIVVDDVKGADDLDGFLLSMNGSVVAFGVSETARAKGEARPIIVLKKLRMMLPQRTNGQHRD